MIPTSDMATLIDDWHSIILEGIIHDMQNYDDAGVEHRDEFTRVLFLYFKKKWGRAYNPNGSFAGSSAARKALEEEGGEYTSYLRFGFNVTGYLERLEDGTVDFDWVWNTFLRDAVKEGWFIKKWKPELGATDFAILQKGPPFSTPARPYIGNRMEETSPIFADQIHLSILSSLRGSGYTVKVNKY